MTSSTARAPQLVGTVPLDALKEARLESHWAAQVPAAAGLALLEKRSDDGHTSLEWDADQGAMLGPPLPQAGNIRVGLRLSDLTVLLQARGVTTAEFALTNKRLSAALAWTQAELGRAAGTTSVPALSLPSYELPNHEVADDGTFAEAGPAHRELATWYDNADTWLRAFADADAARGPVRVWPHHFDIASLWLLSPGSHEKTPQVGVGLSPGDEHFPEPYCYVTPWPHPSEPVLQPLPAGGQWLRKPFLGAILPAHAIVTNRTAQAQARAIADYLEDALAQSLALTRRTVQ